MESVGNVDPMRAGPELSASARQVSTELMAIVWPATAKLSSMARNANAMEDGLETVSPASNAIAAAVNVQAPTLTSAPNAQTFP